MCNNVSGRGHCRGHGRPSPLGLIPLCKAAPAVSRVHATAFSSGSSRRIRLAVVVVVVVVVWKLVFGGAVG